MFQIQISEKNKILNIILNRTEKYNALSNSLLSELDEALEKAKQTLANAVFVSSASEKVFCAGGDLDEMKQLNKESAEKQSLWVQHIFRKQQEIPVPVISFISGFCYGGGLELALHSDIRICTENTKFAMPEINYGIIPGGGGTVLLPKLLGKNQAAYYLFTAENIPLQTAKEQGLIQKVVPENTLQDEMQKQAEYFSKCNRKSLIAIKKMILSDLDTAELYKQEARLFSSLLQKGGTELIDEKFSKKRKS